VLKQSLDLRIYREILARTRPDVVVETGTFAGGSALHLPRSATSSIMGR
jgi:cephalosporin hydroxylase